MRGLMKLLPLSALVLAALLSAPAAAEIVRLKDGTLLHGDIVAFDEASGFRLHRVDNGGEISLRWEHLPPEEVKRIKASRGFTGDEVAPYQVNVVHLVMKNGTTETGVLVEGGKPDSYTLRRRAGTDVFPKQFVRSVEPGKAEGLAIYPAEELYGVIQADLGTPADAAGHFQMAVACEGAGLYELAREHYDAARTLDPKLKPDLIPLRIDRLAVKIEDRDETVEIDEIRNRLYKKQFDEALDAVTAFRERYPHSRQLGELAVLEGDIGRQRLDYYSARVISDYFSFLGKTISEVAREDGMTIGGAMELLEDGVHPAIIKRLAESYRMTEEGIQQLWDTRSGGSVRTAGYGSGTFILGEERALNWIGSDDDEDAPEATQPQAEDDLQKRIEDVLKKREEEAKARSDKSSSTKALQEGITPDQWWDAAPNDDRVRWLTAFYAEEAGHVTVLRAKPRNCRQCNAVGTVPGLNEKGEAIDMACPTCKGLKYERLVNFR
jgi:hypothetical protein